MHTFFAEFMERLEQLHKDLKSAFDGLSPEALDWSPRTDVNSITVLITHTMGAQRYWIGDVAGQVSSNRDRATEFAAHGGDVASLKQRMDATLTDCLAIVATLTIDDLPTKRLSPRHNETFSVAWALLHALEHTATHLGHVQIMRQMWEMRG